MKTYKQFTLSESSVSFDVKGTQAAQRVEKILNTFKIKTFDRNRSSGIKINFNVKVDDEDDAISLLATLEDEGIETSNEKIRK